MQGDYGVGIIGPFNPDHRLTVDGFAVPYLTCTPSGDSRWLLACDNRFMVELDELDMRRVVPFIAHAMAVAAGYSCHGENSREVNPYKVRVSELAGAVREGAGEA